MSGFETKFKDLVIHVQYWSKSSHSKWNQNTDYAKSKLLSDYPLKTAVTIRIKSSKAIFLSFLKDLKYFVFGTCPIENKEREESYFKISHINCSLITQYLYTVELIPIFLHFKRCQIILKSIITMREFLFLKFQSWF